MTNQDNLVKIVKDLTNRGHPMTSKIIAFSIALAVSLPFSSAEAAHKKHHERVHQKIDVQSEVVSKPHKHLAVHKSHIQKASYEVDEPTGKHIAGEPQLASAKALVMDQATGEILFAKNINTQTPIASVTKLMTAMVMLDAHLPMDEVLEVTDADVDTLKGSSSKLPVGSQLTRAELLHMAIMSSENRAA